MTIQCTDPDASAFYVLTGDDEEEHPEVTEYSTPYTGPIELQPEAAAGLQIGKEGSGSLDGLTVVHAVCYSPALRLSHVTKFGFEVMERAPTPLLLQALVLLPLDWR